MGKPDLHVDLAGVRDTLNSPEVAGPINALAADVAAIVRAQGQMVEHGDVELPVTVDAYTTDRGAASVTLAHPAGLAVQAKHGALTKAAAAIGLEVRAQ